MKKVERLKWVERTFGKEFVSPYRVCRNMDQIEHAIVDFENQNRTWGVRTDYPNGHTQGYSLPFIWKGTLVEALKLWNEHKDKFLYIVVENVPRVRLHAVAIKLDAEHVLFEWNDKEPEIWQRQMYRKPENLRQIALGPSGPVGHRRAATVRVT